MRQSLLLCIYLSLLSLPLSAQQIRNLRATNMQDSVRIQYVLEDTLAANSYAITFYAIVGADTIRLRDLKGAVGNDIQPGKHEVTWQAYKEWNRFRGNIRFLIRALPNFTFITPSDSIAVRRASGVQFSWYGANSTLDTLRVELYLYNELQDTLAFLNNTGEFAWKVPPKTPLGDGYRIRVIGLKKSPINEYSPYFTVLPRYPLWTKIALGTAGVAGVVTYYLLRILPPPDDQLERE